MLYRFLHPHGRRLSLGRLFLLALAAAELVFHAVLAGRVWALL